MQPPDFAKRFIDFTRLLEGENRQSDHPDDAEHWYAVYTELVSFKEGLLRNTRDEIQRVPETNPELGGHDIPFLEAELDRLRRGLAFWAERRPKGDNRR